jgi:hypothetical protein
MTLVEILQGLPHLPELFERLRSGRHICADDGPLYLALRAEVGSYRALFEALGFDLVGHDRGFYYFLSGEDLGKEASQLAAFFFILVEAWGDAGKDLEATAFGAAGHRLADLPHLSRDRWRRLMAEANVTNEEELSNLIRRLERYGFAERLADDRFRFRTPVWRFLDLCFEVLNDDHDESTKVNSATGDA